jgi:hypothetical protein
MRQWCVMRHGLTCAACVLTGLIWRIAGHGNWLPWLEREFGWTDRTARNFMAVHEAAAKSEKFSDLNVPVSGLYLLAAPCY